MRNQVEQETSLERLVVLCTQARAKFEEALMMPPTGLFKDRGGDSVPAKLDNPVGRAFLSLIGYYSEKSTALVGKLLLQTPSWLERAFQELTKCVNCTGVVVNCPLPSALF